MKSFQIYSLAYFGISLLGKVGAFYLPGLNPPQTRGRIPPPIGAVGITHPTAGSTSTSSLHMVAQAAIASFAMPTATTILQTTLLPTCLGYYRYEYGVSYGYGTATAATAFLVLRALGSNGGAIGTAAKIHAAAVVFYGLRLNFFLLYRELFLERFRKMRETIEDRQREKEDGKGLIGRIANRTPFILGCACMYAGLAAPPLVGAKLIKMGAFPSCDVGMLLYKILVGCTWFGFTLGAIGDFTKTLVKSRKGPEHLVTGGVFRIFRHPNYTGEVIGWSSSFLASLVAVLCANGDKITVLKAIAAYVSLGFAGALGIIFVLCAAATKLEKRQSEKYGEMRKYRDWVSSSWAGPTFSEKK